MIIILALIKISPAFTNLYYAECISQQLAVVCCPFDWPTLADVLFYLTV